MDRNMIRAGVPLSSTVRDTVRVLARPAMAILLLTGAVLSIARAQSGVYTLNGGTGTQTSQIFAATDADQSAVWVLNSGHLILTNCSMTKLGNSSDIGKSSQYGLNAAVLADSGGVIAISNGNITTNAAGANGLFASGTGSVIAMSGGTISAAGTSAHGIDATYGGSITLTNVNVTTDGSNSSVLATDFGGGTVTVTGGTITAASSATITHSAGIYSTGIITVSGATVTSAGDCGGIVDGANSIILHNTALSGALEGIKIWKTAPGSGTATVTVVGGSVHATNGDAFYVTAEGGTGATAAISVSGGADITAGSGNLLNVVGASTASFTADGVTLGGRLRSDIVGAITVVLQHGTTLDGSVTGASLTMDASSVWSITSNSVLTSLVDPDGISGLTITNIMGNGHDVHYDPSIPANSYLNGHIYTLGNGGSLTPEAVPVKTQTWGALKSLFQTK